MTTTRNALALAAAVAVGLALAGHASAGLVVPTGIEAFHQGDSLNGDGSVLKVIDGSGMTKTDADDPSTWTATSTRWQDDWQGFDTPSPTEDDTWVALDLGANLLASTTMYLWNVQEGGHPDRGMNEFKVYYATDPNPDPPTTDDQTGTEYDFETSGWTLLGTFTLAQGTADGTDTGESFDVSGAAGARYIGFDLLSNHGADDRVGFGEVAFVTTPEPATLALLGAGLGAVLLRRRQ